MRPIGSGGETAVNVRVVCATNRDLRKMILENRFREDLFYRINVVSIHLPPLRERRSDIPFLIARFLNKRKKIDPIAVQQLTHYGWPGNVRELKNLIEKLVTMTEADTITPNDLQPEIHTLAGLIDDKNLSYNDAKKRVIDEFNRAILSSSLIRQGGNVTKAAGELGLDRANFQRLMRKYDISSREFKGAGT